MYRPYNDRDYLPKENNRNADHYLDESEVVTRMLFVLNNFKLVDLKTLDWA